MEEKLKGDGSRINIYSLILNRRRKEGLCRVMLVRTYFRIPKLGELNDQLPRDGCRVDVGLCRMHLNNQ